MAGYVSNNLLRITLQSVRKISGPQYPMLLEQAGLSRYLHELPPADDRPGLPAAPRPARFARRRCTSAPA